ncbi:hypothetical protein NQ317_004524, partial [Molorchus minor]
EIDTLSGLVDNNLCVIFYVFDVDRIDFDALFLLIEHKKCRSLLITIFKRSVSDLLKEISPIPNALTQNGFKKNVLKKVKCLLTPFKNSGREKKKAAGINEEVLRWTKPMHTCEYE